MVTLRGARGASAAAASLALLLLLFLHYHRPDTRLPRRRLARFPPVTSTQTAAPPAETPRPRVLVTDAAYVGGHSSPHPELCPALGARLSLLVLVTSAPQHARARAAVRLTWGHYAARADVALAFAVGSTGGGDADAATAAALAAEDALYGDLVRSNSLDTYSNLTLKTISMLEWADTYCPRARHLLKTDDDVFINVPRLLAFSERHARDTRTIYGKIERGVSPVRIADDSYYVSPLQFAGEVFPDFTAGPAYLLTTDCVRPLYTLALTQPYLRLEDVYITGVIATQLNITRVHSPEFNNLKMEPEPCTIQRSISVHMVPFHEQFELWRKLLGDNSKCSDT